MKLIATVDKNWGIGKAGKRLVNIPSDMREINNQTIGKYVVMGRKTYENYLGLIDSRNREIIVLSKNPDFAAKNIKVAASVEEVLEYLNDINQEEIYVLGGDSVYRELLSYCHYAHINKIDYGYEADCFLENLEANTEWELLEESDEKTYFNLEYCTQIYIRKGNRD